MLVIDASALLSILFRESDSELYQHKILDSSDARISQVNHIELFMVLTRRKGATSHRIAKDILHELAVVVTPMDALQEK
jgi:uncharacterized protein with PIN domain